MTDAEILEVWNAERRANWLPAHALGSVRDDLASLFAANPGHERKALEAGLRYVAASEWWQKQERVTLKFVAANDKLVRYAETYGVGSLEELAVDPDQVVSLLMSSKTSGELEARLSSVRPDGTQPIWIGEIPYALKLEFDEEFLLRQPGRFRLLNAKLICAGDRVGFKGNLCTVERVVRHNLVVLKLDGESMTIEPRYLD